MKYYANGNLYQYLDRCYETLTWRDMIDMLWGITRGLDRIHGYGKLHRNLHGGNLLIEDEKISIDARIGDVGLHGPCNKSSDQIYGVMPYVAPEILRGERPTAASDIYSFGIIMNTFASGVRPWYYRAHDINLARDICNGERPEIPEDTPRFYAELMKQCWDDDPAKRPSATSLNEKLGEWIVLICDDPNPSEVATENSVAEEKRLKMINKIHSIKKIHLDAHYTSKPLYFPELSR